MKAPRGIAERIAQLERSIGRDSEAEASAYMDSLDDYALSRQNAYRIEYCGANDPAAVKLREKMDAAYRDAKERNPSGKHVSQMTRGELDVLIAPGTRIIAELERPLLDALKEAPKPISQEDAAMIAARALEGTGLSATAFSEWLRTDEGINFLRELNGLRLYSSWDFHCLREGRPDQAWPHGLCYSNRSGLTPKALAELDRDLAAEKEYERRCIAIGKPELIGR